MPVELMAIDVIGCFLETTTAQCYLAQWHTKGLPYHVSSDVGVGNGVQNTLSIHP